jgi:hypothetical protein
MTKTILSLLAAAALALPAAAADEKPAKSGFAGFFKNLKAALSQSAVSGQRNRTRGAAVAAVRGEDQAKKSLANPDEPGLVGDAKTRKAAKAAKLDSELVALAELAEGGKHEEALKGFEAFKAKNPRHQRETVDDAIAQLKAKLAETSAPAAE